MFHLWYQHQDTQRHDLRLAEVQQGVEDLLPFCVDAEHAIGLAALGRRLTGIGTKSRQPLLGIADRPPGRWR